MEGMNQYISKEMISWKVKNTAFAIEIQYCEHGINQLQKRVDELVRMHKEHLENKPKR